MRTPHVSKPNLTYVSSLAKAGWDGVVTAPKERVAQSVLHRGIWAPLLVGAGIGVLSACIGKGSKSGHHLAIGGLLGTALGLGGSIAWASRNYTEGVARSVIHKVNDARDAHWLEKNPIAYA
jgi:hypothetical protein